MKKEIIKYWLWVLYRGIKMLGYLFSRVLSGFGNRVLPNYLGETERKRRELSLGVTSAFGAGPRGPHFDEGTSTMPETSSGIDYGIADMDRALDPELLAEIANNPLPPSDDYMD